MSPKLAMIIVNFHRDASALRLMHSLLNLASDEGIECQGVLCDNGRSLAPHLAEGFEILPLQNPGYAAGINQAASRLVADYYLIATHEAEIVSGSISSLIEVLEEGPYAAVGPLLMGRRSEAIFSAGMAWQGRRTVHLRQSPRNGPAAEVEALDGGFWLIGASALERVGPLRESYFLYWEETDWQTRARDVGCKFATTRSFVVRAEPSTSPDMEHYKHRNRYWFLEWNVSRPAAILAVVTDLAWRIPRGIAGLLVGPSETSIRLKMARFRLLGVLHWVMRREGPLRVMT